MNNPLGKFEYRYVGLTERLDEILYPGTDGQVTNFDYHGLSDDFRLKEIEHLSAGQNPSTLSVFEYGYTPNGMIETWSQQAGSAAANTWTFGYDRSHQLRSAVLRDNASTVLESFGYGYDNAGNRTHERYAAGELDDTPGRGAVYNDLNQMEHIGDDTAVRFAGEIDQGGIVWVDGQQATMDVDDSGTEPVQTFEQWLSLPPGNHNVTVTAANESGLTSDKTYPVQILGQNGTTLTHDDAGNLVSRVSGSDETVYRWDGANRLVEIVYPDGSATEFVYDGFGRRIRIVETNASEAVIENRTFVWSNLEILEERDATGADVKKRFFTLGVQTVNGAQTENYFYTRDHLGSIREVTDEQGNLAARYNYDPYGRVSETTGTPSIDADFLFTGHFYHEESGLHLAPYRAYDADLGRWLSRDPAGFIDGPNLYAYVGNNPILWLDPFGQCRGYFDEVFARISGWSLGMLEGLIWDLDGTTGDCDMEQARRHARNLMTAATLPRSLGTRGYNAVRAGRNAGNRGTAAAERARNIERGIPENQLGPSGKPKIHVKEHPTRKRAQDAAQDRSRRGASPEEHSNPTRGDPHFHPNGSNHREHHTYPR